MLQGGLVGVVASALVAAAMSQQREVASAAAAAPPARRMAASAPPAAAPPAAAPPAAALEPRASSDPSREDDERPPPLDEGVWDVAAHDVNGDRLTDLVIATGGPGSTSGRVSLLLNPGGDAPSSSWERISFDTPGDYGRVVAGDIDADGAIDVAALTFSSRVLRWWLLDADQRVRDERSMSFAGATLPGRQCEAPPPVTAVPPTLASLALADLDQDRTLELGLAGYVSGTEGGLFLLSFERQTGCFALRRGFARATPGILKLRFADVDDDGALDLVTSRYALARPSRPRSGCSECLQWGQWWSGELPGSTPLAGSTPLVARLANRALSAADPVPELNVVDFDVVRSEAGLRFALAASAHLCPASDCWGAGQGGFVSLIDQSGQELWSGEAWKADREQQAAPVPGARLLPRAVSFRRAPEQPLLLAGYWWATRHKDSPCSRVSACAGPLVSGALGAAPLVLDSSSFVQALAFTGRGLGPLEQHCESEPRRLIRLPEVPVAVVEVRSKARALPPAAYSWVSGSDVVSLSAEAMRERGRLCVAYAKSARPELAIADSKRGLRLISLPSGG